MRIQWSLLTLLLLTAVVATWTAGYRMRSGTERLQERIDVLSTIGGELLVVDPEQYAIIECAPKVRDDQLWEVWLPKPGRFELKFLTRGIDLQRPPSQTRSDVDPSNVQVVTLNPGRYRLKLEMQKKGDIWHIALLANGEQIIQVEEKADWHGGGHSTMHDGDPRVSRQQSTEQPLEVLNRTHLFSLGKDESQTTRHEPDELGSGLRIWIERSIATEDESASSQNIAP